MSSVKRSPTCFGLVVVFLFIFSNPFSAFSASKTKESIIAICRDLSGSVKNRPDFNMGNLDEVIAHLKNAGGGILAFSYVGKHSSGQTLFRLPVKEVEGNLLRRASINTRNEENVRKFKNGVTPFVSRLRKEKVSDVEGALGRFARFFNEPSIPARAKKVLIFVSDGVHTGPRHIRFEGLPSDIKVWIVGMSETQGQNLFGKNILVFESFDGIISWLQHS